MDKKLNIFKIKLYALAILVLLNNSCTTILTTRERLNLSENKILITLDDGPSELQSVDNEILDILKQHNVKACFSLVTYKLKGNGEILKRIISEGHSIAFHSRNHELYLTKSLIQFESEKQEFEEVLYQEIGYRVKITLFRPPVGILTNSFKNKLTANGTKILYATHNPTDTFINKNSSPKYIENLINYFDKKKGGILVLHNGSELFPRPTEYDFIDVNSAANREWVPEALEIIITTLKNRGYQFVSIDELL